MKNIKKISAVLIAVLLSIGTINVEAIDYASNEGYYAELCSSSAAKEDQYKAACRGYNAYLAEKAQNALNNADKYKGEIAKLEGDIAAQKSLADEYVIEMDALKAEVVSLESDIANLEASIKEIEADIVARQEEIDEKDRIIIERMRQTQLDIRFGYEIEFLLNAQDFESLISSFGIVSDILNYEQEQIKEIDRLIEEQKQDQDAMLVQQEAIEANIQVVKNKEAQVAVIYDEIQVVIKNMKQNVDAMAASLSNAYADASAINDQIRKNQKALEDIGSSSGWTKPISGGYKSAGVWAYPAPWNSIHVGNDYAASVGTPIRAAGNGIVLRSVDGCPTIGGLGNSCGGYAGNHVVLLVSIENKLYGVDYFHMQQGSPIATGTIVTGGQQIGAVGSSGNSSGPHVHVEVIYLGTQSISEYQWNGNVFFGIGMTLNYRCQDGFGAPCRLNPDVVFGG